MSNSLLEIVKGLIEGFDADEGCPEATYVATRDLIESCYGSEACRLFVEHVNTKGDGRYYTRNENSSSRVLSHVGNMEQSDGNPKRRFDLINRVTLVIPSADVQTDNDGQVIVKTGLSDDTAGDLQDFSGNG